MSKNCKFSLHKSLVNENDNLDLCLPHLLDGRIYNIFFRGKMKLALHFETYTRSSHSYNYIMSF